ncbi:hypothetical protein ABEB22_21200 (plasmid) [Thioclava sp. 'Guangxiensis']|uniref:hypothetical protein n=1 Tax=Thioclava sp. 'Guangxiensis' TaxID=3149044 RepID=UPI0032C49193
MHANAFAHLALFGWPLVTWILFRRLPLAQAVIWSLMAGYLLLPEKLKMDLPVLPSLDKATVPALATCLCFYLWRRRLEAGQLRERRSSGDRQNRAALRRKAGATRNSRVQKLVFLVICVLIASPVLTWLTNREPILTGPTLRPAMQPYDIASIGLTIAMLILPFALGLKALRERQAQIWLLRAFVFGGLGYSLAILIEIRMSPQLNVWLYGFFPHDFAQHYRQGGWRPIVFLAHGLRVGMFMAMAVLAAAVLTRAASDSRTRLRWLAITLWLFLALVLSKNTGALMITALFLPVILCGPRLLQAALAGSLAALVMVYPMARGAGILPIDRLTQTIGTYSEKRQQSLEFRLDNEDELLARANLKPLAGWGGWGRNMVFDPVSGRNTSITDGFWIIIIGQYGWIGYLGLFGLLSLPVMLCALAYRRLQLDVVDLGIMCILCANLIDLIPNSSSTAPIWLLAGTLWARYDRALRENALNGRPLRGGSRGPVSRPADPDRSLSGAALPRPRPKASPKASPHGRAARVAGGSSFG